MYVFVTRYKTYAFLCLCFDSKLILCNILVKLQHVILFSYFDKHHNFIYYMINIKLMVQRLCISTCSHVASTVKHQYSALCNSTISKIQT